ncbi:hypothetical protein JCM8795_06410 [Hydrogenobaculum acidophilum]
MDQNQSPLKKLLLQCEIFVQTEEYDKAQKCLEELATVDISKESKEDIEESIKILDYIIEIATNKRLNLAQAIANFNKFKNYLY